MNPLCKFSLAVAGSTVLFCLLMLSRGFAAPGGLRDEYLFAGQDRGGKVLAYVEIERSKGKLDKGDRQRVHIFTERDGWIRLRNAFAAPQITSIGSSNVTGVFGSLTEQVRVLAPAHAMSLELQTEQVSQQRGSAYLLAGGRGRLEWRGRKFEGASLLRSVPILDENLVCDVLGAPLHSSRECLRLGLAGGGSLLLYRQSAPRSDGSEERLGGMLVTDSLSGMVDRIEFKATAWKRIGLYKLPFAWQGSFWLEGQRIYFRVSTERLDNHANLLLMGSRMSVAKGFLKINGRSIALAGLAEVTHIVRGRKAILEDEKVPVTQPIMPGMDWETAKR
jgi:hypothetical protein